MTQTESPVKVLKITGLGRSGSTVLDVVLGNHPDIESVGEVGNLIRTGWVGGESLRGIDPKRLRRPLCTCGKRLDVPNVGDAEACPFWSAVRREWVGRAGGEGAVGGYPRLQEGFELKRRWPRLFYERALGPTARFRSYAGLTRAFFESIRAASGKPIIVDSTMVPVRTFALSMVPGIDLRVVHLVRDGRGVAASEKKPSGKGPQAGITRDHKAYPVWKTAVRWVAHNLASELVCAGLGPGRATRLRYEDFVADPGGALVGVGALVGLDLSGVAEAAASGEPMAAGHNVGGNKTKKGGSVRLRSDAREWEGALSPAELRLSWALMGWLMRRYGYKR